MQKALPKGWKMVQLGDICSLINGKAFKPTEWSETGTPIIRIQNLNDHTKPFNYFKGNVETKHLVKNGDVLLSWSGTPGTSFGAHIWQGDMAVLNQHIFRVEILANRLLKNIFVNAVNLKLYELIRNAHGGVGLSHITKGRLEKIEIPVPPLPTQRKIVEILEEAENLRKLRQQADEKMKDLIPSLFVEMFGDPVSNPKGWAVRRLKDFVLFVKNGLFKKPGEFGAGVPLINVVDLFSGYRVNLMKLERVTATHEEIEKYLVHEGDLFFCRSSLKKEGVAKCAVAFEFSEPTVFECHTIMARIEKRALNPLYASIYLNHPGVRTHIVNSSQTATMTTVGQKDILSQKIFLPPLSLQQDFIKLVEDIEAEKARQAEGRKKLDDLFNSLMQRAFTGELVT